MCLIVVRVGSRLVLGTMKTIWFPAWAMPICCLAGDGLEFDEIWHPSHVRGDVNLVHSLAKYNQLYIYIYIDGVFLESLPRVPDV